MNYKVTLAATLSVAFAASGIGSGIASDAKPIVLVTNDDGYEAPELEALACAMSEVAHVVLAAPRINMGGSSSMARELENMSWSKTDFDCVENAYWLDGPPVAVVRWGLLEVEALHGRKPDLVVSGINPGPNLGASYLYSGTIGAAREAAHYGIKAIAVSNWRGEGSDLEGAAALTAKFAAAYVRATTLSDYVNINFPKGPLSEETPIVITFPHELPGPLEFVPGENDLDGNQSVTMRLRLNRTTVREGSDLEALLGGSISITPMQMERLDERVLEDIGATFGANS